MKGKELGAHRGLSIQKELLNLNSAIILIYFAQTLAKKKCRLRISHHPPPPSHHDLNGVLSSLHLIWPQPGNMWIIVLACRVGRFNSLNINFV